MGLGIVLGWDDDEMNGWCGCDGPEIADTA